MNHCKKYNNDINNNLTLIHQDNTYHYTVTKKRLDFINKLLKMNGKEIYDTYGLKRDEIITETISLPNNYEIDIKCIIPDSEETKPWTEAVLFHHGQEVNYTEPNDEFDGEWTLSDDNHTFTIIISAQ